MCHEDEWDTDTCPQVEYSLAVRQIYVVNQVHGHMWTYAKYPDNQFKVSLVINFTLSEKCQSHWEVFPSSISSCKHQNSCGCSATSNQL